MSRISTLPAPGAPITHAGPTSQAPESRQTPDFFTQVPPPAWTRDTKPEKPSEDATHAIGPPPFEEKYAVPHNASSTQPTATEAMAYRKGESKKNRGNCGDPWCGVECCTACCL
ncbi:hypothetical protein EJ05DRAFT_480166 [Pseudovirgaria hyperparasitica]|uniref:Uncharacterized protein n=1 Tax=Pseudovirgaria hyperparasitica TaxID=470096 RepID=A0A6A6VSY0_9PEZI|nr:uncharacterized protein EJ05DRAFT_480166 [Pseudovirgaria hyperparasitica]KAF2753692.1 hypothetical protein EJ05DRAFT_480166 [Pseudovirgaria hyperparasitica]